MKLTRKDRNPADPKTFPKGWESHVDDNGWFVDLCYPCKHWVPIQEYYRTSKCPDCRRKL